MSNDGPKPKIQIEPSVILSELDSMERDQQIRALEEIHGELTSRLNRAQG